MAVTATFASSTGSAQLALTWVDNGTNEAGFSVERSPGTTGGFSVVATTGAGITAYVDSTVAVATSYCYRVRSFNSGGSSAYSNLACGTSSSGTTQTYGLVVVKAGTGSGTVIGTPAGISCGTSCSVSYTSGTAVMLTATAATGSTFTGWSGGGCSGTGTCVVTLSAATTVTATFATQAPGSYTLTVSKAGTGSGTVTSAPAGINCGTSCAASYASGKAVLLTGVATPGSTFTGWSGGGCSGPGTCTVTLSAATTVTATFASAKFPTLSVSIGGSLKGMVTSAPAGISCGSSGSLCSASYATGTVVTLTASSTDPSYVFSGWSGSGCKGQGTCTVTLSGATAVTATFQKAP
jgi:hypothetical protein